MAKAEEQSEHLRERQFDLHRHLLKFVSKEVEQPPHYAEEDPNTTGTWPAYEAALKANGIKHEGFIYPKTFHGFHNDTTPRFNEGAAKLAWQRTIDHFNKNLKA